MAKYATIAGIHFQIDAERGKPDSQEKVLQQFKEATDHLEGTGLDLLLTCEGMEAIGQTHAMAESPERPGPLYDAYRGFALRNRCTVAGSIKLADQGKVYNAIVFIGPDGNCLGDYRKAYPTPCEEKGGITRGPGARVVDTPAGRLGGVICFDLNFDALRDQYRDLRPDILVFSSMFHGDHLQPNWAYQCRSFLLTACKDNSSDILDPMGRNLASVNYHGRIVRSRVNLDRFLMHQDHNMEHFADIRRKYQSEVTIEINPKLGCALLYSESPDRTASQIAAEFNLVSLDSYLFG